jgi:hypothetical protein
LQQTLYLQSFFHSEFEIFHEIKQLLVTTTNMQLICYIVNNFNFTYIETCLDNPHIPSHVLTQIYVHFASTELEEKVILKLCKHPNTSTDDLLMITEEYDNLEYHKVVLTREDLAQPVVLALSTKEKCQQSELNLLWNMPFFTQKTLLEKYDFIRKYYLPYLLICLASEQELTQDMFWYIRNHGSLNAHVELVKNPTLSSTQLLQMVYKYHTDQLKLDEYRLLPFVEQASLHPNFEQIEIEQLVELYLKTQFLGFEYMLLLTPNLNTEVLNIFNTETLTRSSLILLCKQEHVSQKVLIELALHENDDVSFHAGMGIVKKYDHELESLSLYEVFPKNYAIKNHWVKHTLLAEDTLPFANDQNEIIRLSVSSRIQAKSLSVEKIHSLFEQLPLWDKNYSTINDLLQNTSLTSEHIELLYKNIDVELINLDYLITHPNLSQKVITSLFKLFKTDLNQIYKLIDHPNTTILQSLKLMYSHNTEDDTFTKLLTKFPDEAETIAKQTVTILIESSCYYIDIPQEVSELFTSKQLLKLSTCNQENYELMIVNHKKVSLKILDELLCYTRSDTTIQLVLNHPLITQLPLDLICGLNSYPEQPKLVYKLLTAGLLSYSELTQLVLVMDVKCIQWMIHHDLLTTSLVSRAIENSNTNVVEQIIKSCRLSEKDINYLLHRFMENHNNPFVDSEINSLFALLTHPDFSNIEPFKKIIIYYLRFQEIAEIFVFHPNLPKEIQLLVLETHPTLVAKLVQNKAITFERRLNNLSFG